MFAHRRPTADPTRQLLRTRCLGYQQGRCCAGVGDLTDYELIVELPRGMATLPLRAENELAAYDVGHQLFPGCRLALVDVSDEQAAAQ